LRGLAPTALQTSYNDSERSPLPCISTRAVGHGEKVVGMNLPASQAHKDGRYFPGTADLE